METFYLDYPCVCASILLRGSKQPGRLITDRKCILYPVSRISLKRGRVPYVVSQETRARADCTKRREIFDTFLSSKFTAVASQIPIPKSLTGFAVNITITYKVEGT